MVVVHFKDGSTATFDAATALAPYPTDSLFTLVYASGASIAAVPTENIQYADVQ